MAMAPIRGSASLLGEDGRIAEHLHRRRGGDRYGWVVRGIGKFNSNPKNMIAIGAPYAGTNDIGAVYLLELGWHESVVRAIAIGGIAGGEHFGWSVEANHEVSLGDIYELAIGAPGYDGPAGATTGRCEVWYADTFSGSYGKLGRSWAEPPATSSAHRWHSGIATEISPRTSPSARPGRTAARGR